LIPVFGFLTHEPASEWDNIFHYLQPLELEVIIGKVAVLVSMICSELLYTFLMAKTLVCQILPRAEDDKIPVGITACAPSALALCINFLGEFALEVFSGVASISFSIIGFMLPPVSYFTQYPLKNTGWAFMAAVVLVVGGGMMICSFVLTIQYFMTF
jgi:hypothetical protein